MAYKQKIHTLKVNKREADILWDSVYGRLVSYNNAGDKEKADEYRVVLKKIEKETDALK